MTPGPKKEETNLETKNETKWKNKKKTLGGFSGYRILSHLENEKIISQFVWTSKIFDRHGDRVSKTD